MTRQRPNRTHPTQNSHHHHHKPCETPLNISFNRFSCGPRVSHLERIDVDCLFKRVWVKSRHYDGLYPPLESKLSGTRAANAAVSSLHFRSECVTRMRGRSDCDVIRRRWRLFIWYKYKVKKIKTRVIKTYIKMIMSYILYEKLCIHKTKYFDCQPKLF